jgi:hypothetical protein
LWGQFKSGAEDGVPVSVDRPAFDGTPIIYRKLQKIRENRALAMSCPHGSQATVVGSVSWGLLSLVIVGAFAVVALLVALTWYCISQTAKW